MMMQYDFVDESTAFGNLEMKENMNSYSRQDSFFTSASPNSNIMPTNDLWQSSTSNHQSLYFPISFDFNNSSSNRCQYHTMENNSDYQSLPDVSSSYSIDPYSPMSTNNYSMDPYPTYSTYSSSVSISPTDSHPHHHPLYTNANVTVPSASSSIDIQSDHRSISPPWDSSAINIDGHNVTSTSNSNKQPCAVCHDDSSGYHFGAYTCESCKAFYRRVTKDPNIEIKHSCEIPLPNITKSNRKDCRACRKVKCDRVGMTITPKDRISRTKTTSKSSSIPINDLLEQLAHDLTYDQLSSSIALENLLYLLDLPLILSNTFDSHSLYMNAIHIWRNQSNHSLQIIVLNDTFAVLLFLFYSLTIMKEEHSTNRIKFDKLIHILQQEIHRITGTDYQSACRIKALFMKCFVTLAQYHPNSTNVFDSNYASQSIPYQQYSIYGQ